jgi:putative spermidine/putrescine transport system ATP-binding protein
MTDLLPPATLVAEGSRVELSDVVKDYGSARALSGISLNVEPGEFICLLGPSGCGKTTALRALAGLETVTSGSIRIDGRDVSDLPANKRDIGMVFQSYSLFPHLTARENVEFGLRMRKVEASSRRQRAEESLALVGLGDLGERYAHQLSGGQQQRVALARALVTRPRVLLLDEPLSALDARVRVQLRDEIRRIQTELGITTLFVTHDQEEALAVADRVVVMSDGAIEQVGTPEELYTRPATPFVAAFIGLSNALPGTVSAGEVEVLGTRLPLLDPTVAAGAAVALVRPENIVLEADGFVSDTTEGAGPAVPATVVTSSFLGALTRTTLRLADDTVVSVQHDADLHPEPGAAARLRLKVRPVAVRAAG